MIFSSFTRLWYESTELVKIYLVYNILQTVTYVIHNFWSLRIIFVTLFFLFFFFFCMKIVFCD